LDLNDVAVSEEDDVKFGNVLGHGLAVEVLLDLTLGNSVYTSFLDPHMFLFGLLAK